MSSKHGESDDRKWAESIGLEYDKDFYKNELLGDHFIPNSSPMYSWKCTQCGEIFPDSVGMQDKIDHLSSAHGITDSNYDSDYLNESKAKEHDESTVDPVKIQNLIKGQIIDTFDAYPEAKGGTAEDLYDGAHGGAIRDEWYAMDGNFYNFEIIEMIENALREIRIGESKAKEMGAYADLKGLAEDQWASMSESERQITLNNINMQNYVSERMFKEFYEDDEIPTSFESEIVDAVVSDYGLEDDLHDKQTWESKATEGDTKQVLLDWIDEMGEGWHITPDQVDDFVDYAVSRGIARQDALWYFQNAPSSLGGTTYESKATEDFFDNLNKSDSENEEWEDDDKGGTVDPYTGEPIDEEDKSFWNTGRKKSKEIDTLDSISQAEFDSPYDDLSEDEKQEVNSIMDDPWQGESIDEEPDIGTPFEDTPSGQGESKAGEYEGEDEPEYHDMSNVPDAEEHDVEISEPATEYDVAIDPEEDETPEENEDGQAGNVWQCPECGFNTISKDEYDNHSHSNVPATVGKPQSEESIAQPSNDYSILQRFR